MYLTCLYHGRMPHSLSRDELDRYAGQGFLIVRDVLGDADFAPVEAACERLIDTIARRHLAEGLIASAAEGEGFTTRLARIEEQLTDSEAQVHKRELDIMEARLPEMFAFFFNRNLLAPVESIVGPEITLSPIQHLRPYTPRRGERQPMQVPWHQDQGVTREEADASEILTVWFPLVDVDRTNGCLQVLPGVTRLGLLQHERTGGTHIKPASMPQVEPCDCVMRRGDLLLMSAYTPHHGHQNRSDRVRWSIDLRFQKTGTPTGRADSPEVVVQSRSDPASVQDDYDEWCRRWIASLAAPPQKHHRV